MSEVVYPKAVFHNGVTYNVVVTYHDRRVQPFTEDFFQTEEGRAQMKKVQLLVAELYHIGDLSIYTGNRYQTPVSNRYLEETVFKYDHNGNNDSTNQRRKVSMHSRSGILYQDAQRTSEDSRNTPVVTMLDPKALSSGNKTNQALPRHHDKQHEYTVEDVITAIAMIPLEKIAHIHGRNERERRKALSPFEIRLVRSPGKLFENQEQEPLRSADSNPASSVRAQSLSSAEEVISTSEEESISDSK